LSLNGIFAALQMDRIMNLGLIIISGTKTVIVS